VAWLNELKQRKQELARQDTDPWRLRLERVRGKVGDDGIERISTQTLFDHLDVANAAVELARVVALPR